MDDIAEFTELGEALDRPLRTYSSGMRARSPSRRNDPHAGDLAHRRGAGSRRQEVRAGVWLVSARCRPKPARL